MVKLRENPDPSFVNLIARCLEWDPKKRLTPDEGLNHEWIIKGLPPGILIQHQQQMQKSRQDAQSKNSSEPHPSPRGAKAAASISSSNASQKQSRARGAEQTTNNNKGNAVRTSYDPSASGQHKSNKIEAPAASPLKQQRT